LKQKGRREDCPSMADVRTEETKAGGKRCCPAAPTLLYWSNETCSPVSEHFTWCWCGSRQVQVVLYPFPRVVRAASEGETKKAPVQVFHTIYNTERVRSVKGMVAISAATAEGARARREEKGEEALTYGPTVNHIQNISASHPWTTRRGGGVGGGGVFQDS